MAYDVIVGKDAFDRINGIPEELISAVERKLLELATDPAKLGRAACFPFVPVGHIFPFNADCNNRRYYFTAFFLYGPGEHEISITDVTMSPQFRPEKK